MFNVSGIESIPLFYLMYFHNGLIFNLIAQIFWLYSSYKAWENANQIGMFITTIIMTLIILGGVINYWFL
jgi:hypothetical protein